HAGVDGQHDTHGDEEASDGNQSVGEGAGSEDDDGSESGGDNSDADASDHTASDEDEVIRAALSRSRSSSRRSSSGGAGTAESPIQLNGSGVPDGSSDSEAEYDPRLDPPRSVLLASDFRFIPGFSQAHPFTDREVALWIADEVGSLRIQGLTVCVLAKRRLLPPGFLFPIRDKSVKAPKWKRSLITGPMVKALMDSEPWSALDVPAPPLTFDPNQSMGDLADAYCSFEDKYRQAYWEATHYLQIPLADRQADPWLDKYCADRKQRRSHAGASWKRILKLALQAMKNQLCDLDLLLDPFFLVFPSAADEHVAWYPGSEYDPKTGRLLDPSDLIQAAKNSDRIAKWRCHYRGRSVAHPATSIARLKDKFVPA
ncbi:hypothetical protein BBJ28_00024503, partial [Nothophytophthora sp. Chile5]